MLILSTLVLAPSVPVPVLLEVSSRAFYFLLVYLLVYLFLSLLYPSY